MIQQTITTVCRIAVMSSTLPTSAFAQKPPYDVVCLANQHRALDGCQSGARDGALTGFIPTAPK
jgi:hypothetical protein